MARNRRRDPAKDKIRSLGTFTVMGTNLTRSDLGRLLACVRDINKDRVKDGKPRLMYRYQ